MDPTAAIETLENLERKIAQTARLVSDLRTRCKTLETDKTELKEEITTLRQSNIELSKKINDLKILHEKSSNSFDKEEVRKKIDRMLEKFGELRL